MVRDLSRGDVKPSKYRLQVRRRRDGGVLIVDARDRWRGASSSPPGVLTRRPDGVRPEVDTWIGDTHFCSSGVGDKLS